MTRGVILRKDPEARRRTLAFLWECLADLPDNREYRVEWKQYRKQRTIPQNSSLWGVAYPPIRESTGYEMQELHDVFCGGFFGWKEIAIPTVNDAGEYEITRMQKPRRTTTEDENGKRDVIPWDRFKEFYAYVQRQGAELGVFVPDPDPYHDGGGS